MRHTLLKAFLLILGSLAIISAQAQPFRPDIDAFKAEDKKAFPEPGQILFVGSSSFTYWKNVQSDFPGYKIINRGFGGSSLPHVIKYAPEIIYPYKPRQIIIYCGENDINDGASPKLVFARFKKLYSGIRKHLGQVNVVYISIKPSPSRIVHLPRVQEANTLISKFIAGQKNTEYIDVFSLMLKPDGSIMPDIFISDKLHMNAKGYDIWARAIKPYLLN